MTKLSISPVQCKGARAMLGWSQDELAQRAGVAKQTLADFERGSRSPYARTLADIQKALEAGGVEFTDGDAPGVRMRGKPEG